VRWIIRDEGPGSSFLCRECYRVQLDGEEVEVYPGPFVETCEICGERGGIYHLVTPVKQRHPVYPYLTGKKVDRFLKEEGPQFMIWSTRRQVFFFGDNVATHVVAQSGARALIPLWRLRLFAMDRVEVDIPFKGLGSGGLYRNIFAGGSQ
jgi:hypothetical protein